ncbi:lipopolysaccharide biosynthesis protein [Erythrobacter sp. NFXS35]|uniref:lipopolysaccharide biosynthesis protein n=1 Tax=Erythrobacter sp. NFXS35 TaxID=2818436 RepID=UPI0032DEA204
MTGSARGSLSKGAAWIGSSRLLVNGLGLISTLVLARLLVPEDFGLVALAESIFAMVAAITELSLAHALIQHRKPQAHHYHTAWTLNLIRAVLLAAVMAALGFVFARIYGDARLIDLFFVLAGATVIGGLENPMLVTFTRKLIFWQEFALNVASKFVGFAVAITIAYVFRSFWALVLGSLAAQLARVIVSYTIRPYRPRFSFSGYRDLLSFSVWLTLSNGIQTANWRLDPVLLGLFVPTSAVGQYTVGNRIAYLPVKEGLGPIRTLFFPAFSRMQDDLHRLRTAYLNAQGLVCLLAMPIGFGFAVVARPLVELAMGSAWLPAVPVIQVLVILSALQVSESSQPLAMALDRTKEVFKRDMRVFMIRIPIVFAGLIAGMATDFGALMGMVAGRALSSLINIGLNVRLVAIITGISVATQMSVVWRPVVAAGAMSAAVVAIMNRAAVSPMLDEPFLNVGITVGLGAILYPALLTLLWLGAGRPDGAERASLAFLNRTRRSLLERAKARTP